MRVGILGPINIAVLLPHLQDPPPLPPGAGTPSVSLVVDGLVQAGHHVTVWTLDPRVQAPLEAEGPNLRLWCGPQPAAHRGRTFHRDERRALAIGLASARVDVLNAHWTYEYAWAALHRPEPLIITARDWPPTILRLQPSPYRAIRLLVAARVLAARPAIVAPSDYLAQKYRRLGLDTTVIPNGIPADAVASKARVRGSGMRILSVASGFDGRKNTAALLHAHALLRRRGLDARLQMVGAGHGPGEAAAAWARQKGLIDGVEFSGRLPFDDVLSEMRAADVLVHSSREESYGRVLVEAMAQALPVVGGRRSGAVPWVLDHGRAGVLVDVRSPEAIATAVADVLTDTQRWEALSAAGRSHALAHFTMEPIVDAYLARFDAAIAGSAPVG